MKKLSVCSLCTLVLSCILAFGVVSFLGPCVHDDGSFGACHWAGRALFGMGILLIVLSLLALFCKEGKTRSGVLLSMIPVAVLGASIPGTLIDLCRMATMRCRALMQPASVILCTLIGLLSLIGSIMEYRKAGKY